MRTQFFVLLLALSSARVSEAQPGQLAPLARASNAKLVHVIETDPADSGRKKPGELVTRRVAIENISNASIRVRVLGTSCPCTKAGLSVENVDPGDSTVLTLTTTAAEVATPQIYSAQVEAASASGRQLLTIPISYSPSVELVAWPSVVNIWTLPGQPGTARVCVRRPDGRNIRISGISPVPDWLSTAGVKPDPHSVAAASIELASQPKAIGLYRGHVDLAVEGDAGPPMRVDVCLHVRPFLSPTPAGIIIVQNANGLWKSDDLDVSLTLDPAAGSDLRPSRAIIAGAETPIEVAEISESDAGWTLRTRLRSDLNHQRCGESHLSVVDRQGVVLVDIPVVWLSLPAPANP